MKDKKKLFIIIGAVLLLLALIITCVLLKKKPTKTEEIIITFNVDGGEITENIKLKNGKEDTTINADTETTIQNVKAKKGTEITLPKAIKDGFNFMGWYIGEDKQGDKVTLDKDTIITAKWEQIPEDAKTFTVTFNSNGGTSVDKLTVECDKELTLPANPKKEGYTFISWVDQNERPILDQALLTCEDITLYANWEKEEKKEEKKETVQEQPKEKKYTCPDGYELKDDNKCVSIKSPESYCPGGTKYSEKANVCYRYIREVESITCKNGGYYYAANGTEFCGYEELASYTGNPTMCQQAGGTYVQSNSHCFKRIEQGTANLQYECSGRMQYKTQNDLGGNAKSGCYDITTKKFGCETVGEGYSMNYTLNKCVKTIDATLQ